eukprot:1196421-Prorocentrum_minimum.AAC.3
MSRLWHTLLIFLSTVGQRIAEADDTTLHTEVPSLAPRHLLQTGGNQIKAGEVFKTQGTHQCDIDVTCSSMTKGGLDRGMRCWQKCVLTWDRAEFCRWKEMYCLSCAALGKHREPRAKYVPQLAQEARGPCLQASQVHVCASTLGLHGGFQPANRVACVGLPEFTRPLAKLSQSRRLQVRVESHVRGLPEVELCGASHRQSDPAA